MIAMCFHSGSFIAALTTSTVNRSPTHGPSGGCSENSPPGDVRDHQVVKLAGAQIGEQLLARAVVRRTETCRCDLICFAICPP